MNVPIDMAGCHWTYKNFSSAPFIKPFIFGDISPEQVTEDDFVDDEDDVDDVDDLLWQCELWDDNLETVPSSLESNRGLVG